MLSSCPTSKQGDNNYGIFLQDSFFTFLQMTEFLIFAKFVSEEFVCYLSIRLLNSGMIIMGYFLQDSFLIFCKFADDIR